jgi:hypothetical protein
MAGEISKSRFTALTGLNQYGTVVAGLVAAATSIGGVAIWGADKARQIDVSEKKTVELQQQIEILKSDLDKFSLALKSLPTESSSVGPAGDPGPVGPQGLRGEKGERGEKGVPGESSAGADAETIRAIVVEEIKKLPEAEAAATTGVAMAEVNSDCTVLKPTDDKFRLVFKKGMMFCAPDGELLLEVREVQDAAIKKIGFSVPGEVGWSCHINDKCRIKWLGSYRFHIEKIDSSGPEPQAITIFKKES